MADQTMAQACGPVIRAYVLPELIERPALLGWRLYPRARTAKAACFKGFLDAATHDLDTLARWHRDYPGCSWCVVFEGSGIVGLDVDAPGDTHDADGIANLARLVERHGPIPKRPMTRSANGGYGLFFKDPGHPLIRQTGNPAPGIDPRSGRQTMTIPPSTHPATNRPYGWAVAPWDVDPPPMPDWLLGMLRPPPEPILKRPQVTSDSHAQRRLFKAAEFIMSAASGAANDTLNRHAYAIARHVAAGSLSQSDAVATLFHAARQRKIPEREAKDTIKSAFTKGLANPIQTRVQL